MTGRLKQLFWVLPLLLAGLVAGMGWWGNCRLRETIQNELKAQLATTLNANVTALGIWATNQSRLAVSLAEDAHLQSIARRIFQADPRVRQNLPPLPDVNEFVRDLKPRLTQLGYETAQLVNSNFMIVANSQRGPLGANVLVSDAHTNKFAELFATGKPVIITPFKPELLLQWRAKNNSALPRAKATRRLNNSPATAPPHRRGDVTLMQVATPVCDPAGHIVGALALIINPDQEFSRILSVARSGASGETYAFDQTGLLISHSRFDEQLKQLGLLDASNTSSALNLRLHDPGSDLTQGFKPPEADRSSRPLISLVADAVDGADEVRLEPTRDYRGVLVVGASRWLPQFGFGVATQLDATEAFRPLHLLQWLFVGLVLVLLLCATGLFVLSNLTWQQQLDEVELKLKQLGQYTLEEKIGEGGMGVVYRARHALLRRDTAVKLLLPDRADPAAIARFEWEVCLTCQLTHPNTIQVYDYGHTPDGIFYYAMEFLRGLNLHDLVAHYGPQPEGRVVHIMAQICDSLAEAHALGLIHRDIKPGNIFLCQRGGIPDCVKVLDFGLVRDYRVEEIPPAEVEPGAVVEGTPWFTPPEAIQNPSQADPRSDLYAVGVLGYYLLTGQYIFDAETVAEIHEKQLLAVPVPPSQRTPNPISAEMEQIILRCLEKEVTRRPQSAAELRALLQACPTAAEWTADARMIWWEAYARETLVSDEVSGTDPMPSVSIDLAARKLA